MNRQTTILKRHLDDSSRELTRARRQILQGDCRENIRISLGWSLFFLEKFNKSIKDSPQN